MIGLDTLYSKTVTVPEDFDEDTRMIECCLNTDGGQFNLESPFKFTSSTAQEKPEGVDQYGRLIRRTIMPETGKVVDSTRTTGYGESTVETIQLPFVFPAVHNDIPDIVSLINCECMKSVTQVTLES